MSWCLLVAAGPSLRRKDVDLLRPHFDHCVAVCGGIFYTPTADTLFAADSSWWIHYGPKIRWYKGERVSRTFRGNGVRVWHSRGWQRMGGNSGHMAIQDRVDQGWKKLALIGFDFKHSRGKAHFHGNHPPNMGNAPKVHCEKWARYMALTALELAERGVEVVNLSRDTAIDCFPRMTPARFLKVMMK